MALKLPGDSDASKALIRAGAIFIALILLQFFSVISTSWLDFKAYSYGFIAAPLVCLLSWYRFIESESKVESKRPFWIIAFMVLLCLVLVPIRIVERVDPFWRLPIWFHACAVLLLIHCTVTLLWSVRRSVAILPGTLLLFTVVPLPSVFEGMIIGRLTSIVTVLDVQALVFQGYPIDLLGNTFLVNGNLLDVSEGCSGIRSFQGAIVTSLLMGEFLSLSFTRRVFLLVMGVLMAIFFNALRIYILTATAFDKGAEAEQKIHDQVGMMTLFGIYGSILLIAILQNRFSTTKDKKKSFVRKVVSE